MIENLQSLVSHADETPAGMELADLASESVIVCDVEGTIRYWNPASEALYGWPARAAVGRRRSAVRRAASAPASRRS